MCLVVIRWLSVLLFEVVFFVIMVCVVFCIECGSLIVEFMLMMWLNMMFLLMLLCVLCSMWLLIIILLLQCLLESSVMQLWYLFVVFLVFLVMVVSWVLFLILMIGVLLCSVLVRLGFVCFQKLLGWGGEMLFLFIGVVMLMQSVSIWLCVMFDLSSVVLRFLMIEV